MIEEAALVTVSCVLFVQMGLSGAMQETLGFHSEILSCPKCCTFWSVLVSLICTGNGIIPSVAASFLSSYCAMWLSLLYDALARLYNHCYDELSKTSDTPEDAEADTDEVSESGADEVS